MSDRHASAQRMAVERARSRPDMAGADDDDGRERFPMGASSPTRSVRVPPANPLHDQLLRELVRSVAQATIEYAAEQDYDGPAEMYAERTQLAEEVARFTFACAEEEPGEGPLNDLRRALR